MDEIEKAKIINAIAVKIAQEFERLVGNKPILDVDPFNLGSLTWKFESPDHPNFGTQLVMVFLATWKKL